MTTRTAPTNRAPTPLSPPKQDRGVAPLADAAQRPQSLQEAIAQQEAINKRLAALADRLNNFANTMIGPAPPLPAPGNADQGSQTSALGALAVRQYDAHSLLDVLEREAARIATGLGLE